MLNSEKFGLLVAKPHERIRAASKPKAEHLIFTKAWRDEIGHRGSNALINTTNATKDDVIRAARKIYKDYPEILKALGL